eukprot:1559717-Alexandrium_andersonii.AAC.1
MSASLVGSEMCIRDSYGTALRGGSLHFPAPGGGCRAPRPPCGSPWPVSYTHLTLPTICSV